uniref:Domain of unknown function DB domain-containing protein n=1 Tax=Strongyloides stercoralis TaxID=6248 RepID=A0A0K0ERN9_STRER
MFFILFLLLFINGKCRLIYEDLLVKKCCNEQTYECCMESLIYKKSLNCKNISNLYRSGIEDCLHRNMYPYEKYPLKFIDSTCCHVFKENLYDPNDVCYYTCISITQKYYLSTTEKWNKIKNCIKKNPTIKCFNKCINWSSINGYNQFIYDDHCNWSNKLKPGYIHLGKELDS